jgi:nitrite reductase/ring-hydroxylating ferredoxin subunit
VLVSAGRLLDLPTDHCVAVAGGAAVVVRVGDEARAFSNQCVHAGASLTGAPVDDGDLTCPGHFWRFRVSDGRHVPSGVRLEALPVLIANGEVLVEVSAAGGRSMREVLLDHARAWDRDRKG